MVDYTAERGWLTTTLKVQQLMQSIIQASWFDASEFLTLPNVKNNNVYVFYNVNHKDQHLNLPVLKDLCRNNYEKLAGPLRDAFEEHEIEQIYKILQAMPELMVSISIQGRFNDNKECLREITSNDSKSNVWTKVHSNEVNLYENIVYFLITTFSSILRRIMFYASILSV